MERKGRLVFFRGFGISEAKREGKERHLEAREKAIFREVKGCQKDKKRRQEKGYCVRREKIEKLW